MEPLNRARPRNLYASARGARARGFVTIRRNLAPSGGLGTQWASAAILACGLLSRVGP